MEFTPQHIPLLQQKLIAFCLQNFKGTLLRGSVTLNGFEVEGTYLNINIGGTVLPIITFTLELKEGNKYLGTFEFFKVTISQTGNYSIIRPIEMNGLLMPSFERINQIV